MSDWVKLNKFRERTGPYATDDSCGFNGAFYMIINGLPIKILASDGGGWQHVSVSVHLSTVVPSWYVMCKVKDLFWEPEDCVMQLHPPQSQYVNFHPGCLHLWRPTSPGVTIPQPPAIMVGPFSNDVPQ